MKLKLTNLCKCALVLVIAGTVGIAQADQKTDALRTALSKVATAEVPAKAAEIVANAKAADRESVTAEVVKLVVKSHPTMNLATVSAISSKCPAAAPTAAAAAAKLQPKQATLIAKAAAVAAPDQAGAIVSSVCKIVTNQSELALAVAEAAPHATMEILDALENVMPNMKPRIDVAIASFNGNVPSVAAVLDRASSGTSGSLTTPAGSGVRGPQIGAPYVPKPAVVNTITPATSGLVTGPRDYSAP